MSLFPLKQGRVNICQPRVPSLKQPMSCALVRRIITAIETRVDFPGFWKSFADFFFPKKVPWFTELHWREPPILYNRWLQTDKCFCVEHSLGLPSSESCPEKHPDNRHLTSGSMARLPRGLGNKKPIQKLYTKFILWGTDSSLLCAPNNPDKGQGVRLQGSSVPTA